MNKKQRLKMNLQLFATPTNPTEIANLIDPEVMADMISAQLPNKLRFAPLARVDRTLVGQPGSTLTVPKFKYIGDAEDVAEGGAVPYSKLETTTADFTIKKVAKGVEITDEALLSGLGDPLGEAENQILMAIANKIDNDTLKALQDQATLKFTGEYWNVDTVSDALDMFDDEHNDNEVGERVVLVMNNKDASVLRKAVGDDWERASDLGDQIVLTGAYGKVLDAEVSRSKKLKRGEAYLVKESALRIFLKRDVFAEKGRDMDNKFTKVNADQHYGVYLYDESKAVKITVSKPSQTKPEETPAA